MLPTMSWTKKDIQNWLIGKNVPYSADDTKAQLLEKAGVE